MATFSANPAKPPSFSTGNISGTVQRWVIWAVLSVAGLVVLATAIVTVGPRLSMWLNRIPGVRAPSAPFAGVVGGGGSAAPSGWEGA